MLKFKWVLGILAILTLLIGSSAPFLVGTSPAVAQGENPYVVRTFVDEEGNEIAMIVVPGRPPEVKVAAVDVPEPKVQMGINNLTNVPAFNWSYGCSATSAAMLFGYYDRTGYDNMYAGPTNGGVCPLDNSTWGPGIGGSDGECPLSATHDGIDGRTIYGHVDDYWISYGSPGPDPWEGNWTEHTQGDCTGDYMGTSQWKYGSPVAYNSDGGTLFFWDDYGNPTYDYTDAEPTYRDGCHGMRLFAESRGYTVVTNFNQFIYGQAPEDPNNGFTFADYMAEIDAGRPVIIQVEQHSMLGYGYDTTGNTVYIHDTWDYSSHTMTWGGTYSIYNLQHYGVTVFQLEELAQPSEVWVDDDYDPSTPGWGYDHFANIQDGIDAVAGSIVNVAAGYYTENITLIDGVEVLGAGAGVTTIDGGGSGSVVTADGVGSATVLDGFTITNGNASNGGGMYNEDSSPTVTNCTFSGNTATNYGGGMYNFDHSSPTVSNCTFSGNSATYGGGMLNFAYSSPTVTNCTFSSNTATSYGGGMYNVVDSLSVVTNCTFSGNSADRGGGVNNEQCSPTVTNCTFSGNSATSGGSGMYNWNSASPAVTNCILWDGGDEIHNDGTSTPVVTYCDVQGGYSGTGNIDADPLFVGGGDFHLQSGSPCIDVGDNSASSLPSTDFEGNPRLADGDWDSSVVVDMGADEYSPVLGLLRVESSPAVPTTMFADGIPVNDWGLDWVKMPVGEYILSFTDVPGFLTPTEVEVTHYPPGDDTAIQLLSEPIEILPDTVTEVVVYFIQLGNLRVQINPVIPDPPTIFVDGNPMNDWGLWVSLEAGQYTVSFQEMDGYLTPPPIVVTVTAGVMTEVFGDYENGLSWES